MANEGVIGRAYRTYIPDANKVTVDVLDPSGTRIDGYLRAGPPDDAMAVVAEHVRFLAQKGYLDRLGLDRVVLRCHGTADVSVP